MFVPFDVSASIFSQDLTNDFLFRKVTFKQ